MAVDGSLGRVRLDRPAHLIRRCDTIGKHVVHLVDDGYPVTHQPFSDVHLPQRTIPVQRSAGDLADELVEFTTPARCGYRHLPQVVVDVECGVLDPHRVVQLERDVDQLIAQRPQRHQSRLRNTPEQLEAEPAVESGDVENSDLQRVHVNLGGLAVQQQCVDTVESPHCRPPLVAWWNLI